MKRRTGGAPELPHVEEVELPDGRKLVPGVEFSIVGGGRYRFRHGYVDSCGVTAFGPIGGSKAPRIRTFFPEVVKTIHRRRTE